MQNPSLHLKTFCYTVTIECQYCCSIETDSCSFWYWGQSLSTFNLLTRQHWAIWCWLCFLWLFCCSIRLDCENCYIKVWFWLQPSAAAATMEASADYYRNWWNINKTLLFFFLTEIFVKWQPSERRKWSVFSSFLLMDHFCNLNSPFCLWSGSARLVLPGRRLGAQVIGRDRWHGPQVPEAPPGGHTATLAQGESVGVGLSQQLIWFKARKCKDPHWLPCEDASS